MKTGCLLSISIVLVGVSAAPTTWADDGGPYVLVGTLVTPDKIIPHGEILVQGGRIADVGPSVAVPAGAPVIDTHGIIFPGPVDLHNHITWNLFPRWRAGHLFNTRYDWLSLPAYVAAFDVPQKTLTGQDKLGCEMDEYGEIKAIVNGATSIAGTYYDAAMPQGGPSCVVGLARNLDFASGL